MLYGIAFTIKMSYKGTHKIKGFFAYVVPPLEGLWWQENTQGLDYARKEDMHFISMIRGGGVVLIGTQLIPLLGGLF